MLLLMVNRFLAITDENPYIEQIFLGLICMIFSVDFFVIMIQFYKIHYDKWQVEKLRKSMMVNQVKKKISYLVNVMQNKKLKQNEKEKKKDVVHKSEDDLESIASISESGASDYVEE